MAAGEKKNEHSEEQTFGRLLKTLRTEKGFDLQTVSNETKIAVSTLRLLEEEAYDKLPDTVFVKGFLKAYSKMVDASPDTIIQNFLAGRHHYEETLRYEAGLSKSTRSILPWFALAAVVFACVLYAVFSVIKAPHSDRPLRTAPPVSDTKVSADGAGIPKTTVPTVKEATPPQSAYLLEINAVEETWLKIAVDHQDPKQYLLNPGDRLELKASSGFNLVIGNATGINVRLNNKSIAIAGKHGQVVTLKVP